MFKKAGTADDQGGASNGTGAPAGNAPGHMGLERTLVAMIVVCSLVTAGAMFSGFVSMGGSGPVEIALSGLFTLVVTAGLAICATLMFITRRRLLRGLFFIIWCFGAFISVLMGFGLYFDLTSSSTAAKIDIRSAVNAAVAPLMAVQSGMSRTSKTADALASYSAEQARIETVMGGTCDGVVIAAPGPRRDLRAADQASFGESAKQLRSRAAEVAKEARAAQNIALNYDPKNHAQAVAAIDTAFSQVRALTDDGVITDWQRKVSERIAAAGKPFVSAKGGQFYCRDPGLLQRLRDAAAIKMPTLPKGPPAITEPTHAESVRRGLALATFQRPFDLRLDLLPLMLGVTLDVMLLLFSGAHALLKGYGRGEGDPNGEPEPSSPVLQILKRLRGIRSDEITFVETLDEALRAETTPVLAVYDDYSVQRDEYDYLVVRQRGGGPECAMLRGFALLLREEEGVKLHWTGPVSVLPERIRADLKARLTKTVRVALYEIRRDTITRYKLAKLASLIRARNGEAGIGQPDLKVVKR